MFIVTKHKRLYKVLTKTVDFIQKFLGAITFLSGLICCASLVDTTRMFILSRVVGIVLLAISYSLIEEYVED